MEIQVTQNVNCFNLPFSCDRQSEKSRLESGVLVEVKQKVHKVRDRLSRLFQWTLCRLFDWCLPKCQIVDFWLRRLHFNENHSNIWISAYLLALACLRPYVCLFACFLMFVCLLASLCLFVCLLNCLFICFFFCWFVKLFVHLSFLLLFFNCFLFIYLFFWFIEGHEWP